MKGIIFNIQKFSIHDGPGIRTTVFLKGCPLHCQWCANPESQFPNPEITYVSKNCTSCKRCEKLFPEIKAFKEKNLERPLDLNVYNKLLEICPNKAFVVEGKERLIKEVINKVLDDLPFYEESGGGVTISGGEAFYQSEFVGALVKELKKLNIHLAIETTGFVSEGIFKKLSPQFDLLLFDLKHFDPKKHKEGTGVENDLILKNLRWALAKNLNILIRIPVIPGFNDTLEDAQGFVKLLKSLKIKEVELLPFHQFGESKYDRLCRNYKFEGVKALKKEDLKDFVKVFEDNLIRVK